MDIRSMKELVQKSGVGFADEIGELIKGQLREVSQISYILNDFVDVVMRNSGHLFENGEWAVRVVRGSSGFCRKLPHRNNGLWLASFEQ